jgi:3-dehydroquinate synthase
MTILFKVIAESRMDQWFAEVIKHACIKDASMFKLLERSKLIDFQKDKNLLDRIIQKNALLKSRVVQEDEFETGNRKLLNFGHTFGHAIENTYALPHGHAVAIGMVVACLISESYKKFRQTDSVVAVIRKYGLPAYHSFDAAKVLAVMGSDKKKVNDVNKLCDAREDRQGCCYAGFDG